jgi:hypothetical protein
MLEHLLALGANAATSAEVHAVVRARVTKLKTDIGSSQDPNRIAAVARIDEFLKNPEAFKPTVPTEAPPGMPIGDEGID